MHHRLHPASALNQKDKSSDVKETQNTRLFSWSQTTPFGLGIGSKQKTIAPCIVRGWAASKHIVWFWIIIDKLIDLGPPNLLDFVFYSIEAKAKKYQIQNPAIKLTLYQIHPTIQNTTHNY